MHISYRNMLRPASSIALALLATSAIAADPESSKITEARQESQIWTTYALSPYLRANDLSVTVADGKATLTGTVNDSVDKELAQEIALGVTGITDVDNAIKIAPDHVKESAAERSYADRIDDAGITAAVKSKLLWDRNTDGLSAHLTTTAGRIEMTGTAHSAEAKALAGRIAAGTRGVVAVDNQLTVTDKATVGEQIDASATTTSQNFADSWITTRVKSTYMYSSNVDGSSISVSTADGVVTLSGQVDSGAERALAIELAQNTRGVISVDSKALIL